MLELNVILWAVTKIAYMFQGYDGVILLYMRG